MSDFVILIFTRTKEFSRSLLRALSDQDEQDERIGEQVEGIENVEVDEQTTNTGQD
ncbi:hypothetical protein [Candidatus Nitrotoga arctica]|uniref:hypothetical protein n=1 Tax=Candidatus Nitrotoga arctica TaxID=453162 RepID=UPI001EFBE312|nr:hypothetical protein [Candidatus Nitrotoga arctica]